MITHKLELQLLNLGYVIVLSVAVSVCLVIHSEGFVHVLVVQRVAQNGFGQRAVHVVEEPVEF